MERREARHVRPRAEALARMALAGPRTAALRRLCRRPRRCLAERLRGERAASLRAAHVAVHGRPAADRRRLSPSAPRATWGALGRRVASRQACRRADVVTV